MPFKQTQSFADQVLDLIRTIPPGSVTTYAAVAMALGRPRAVRAVGNALHANPNPGAACPCHRVVRSDRTVGGYALGVQRKRLLLQREGVSIVRGRVEPTGWLASEKLKTKSVRLRYALRA